MSDQGAACLHYDDVHVWLAFLDRATEQQYLLAASVLDAGERARSRHFVRRSDRVRHVVSRVVLRTVLSRYSGTRPSDWKFVRSNAGRPTIEELSADEEPLFFNLSHTDDVIALAVARRKMIGVDVEHIKGPSEELLRVAEHFFAAEEAMWLRSLLPGQRLRAFFELWTLKEAYVKACGQGLAMSLDRVSFRPDASTGSLIAGQVRAFSKGPLHFAQFHPTASHAVAVCSAGGSAPRVLVMRYVPMP